jgi:flavin reductase (DIM6/NTAB) family NADH-FMN oxidoreductase RutF
MSDTASTSEPESEPESEPVIEPRHFRETLGHYPTGVAVVTAVTEENGPVGMVVGSFTSVSLDPPLVAFMPQKTSGTFELLRTATSFCVNVLSADQEKLCRRFATSGADKFDGVTWEPAPSGAPVLSDVVAWIDCSYESIVEAGDHYIVIGRVGAVDVVKPALPLLFFQGGYGRFSLPSLVAGADPDMVHSIRLAEYARDEMEAVADEFGAECSVLAPVGEDAVFVALASRSPEPSNVSLGFHVPLVPPIGSIFISHLGSVAVNAWLSRIPESDEETRAAYIGQLERVRARGYSLSLRGSHSDRQMFTAVRDYSSPDRLPEHERRFRTIIREQAHLYEPEIEPDGTYDLHSIVVPVPGPLGLVQIALRLASTPRGASGRQVQQWIARLQEAAETVAERIAAEQSAQLLAEV